MGEKIEEGAAAGVKRVNEPFYPDPPRGMYSKFQISGVSGLRAGVSR